MKSKYYQSLFLVGILPVLCLVGVYFWMLINQVSLGPSPSSSVDTTAVRTTIPLLQTQIKTIGSTIGNAVQKTYGDVPNLFAHHTDADLENFTKTHPGVAGVVVLSMAGHLEKTVPAAPPLVDPGYGASEEFQKTADKLKNNGGKAYLFYTQKFAYPALVFAVPLSGDLVAEAVLSLSNFFRATDLKSGEIFLLDAGSGNYLYHSNPSKLGTSFNPDQEPWLSKIQSNIMNKQEGAEFNPDKVSAVYAYAGFGNCGIVHLIPSAALQPAAVSAPTHAAKAFPENIPDLLQTPSGITGLIAAALALGWVFIVGGIYFSVILGPLKKASEAVLGAAQGSGKLSPEVAQRFGHDEIGKMVHAVSAMLEKLDKDKHQASQEKEEALRKGKTQVDEKMREAANQVADAQKQAQSVRGELNDKNQALNDKLRELDALKGMSEGLRTQNEQAKGENAKLRSQIALAEEASTDLKKRVVETQGRLIEMESKMLQTVAASSAIQVSAVRAAAIRTMADELKTTLGIIKGYVSSALGTTQGGINEKQQEFLGMVINRSARLEKFINDLLDIYQVETEQAEAKHEEVNLASEIEGLAFNFQAQADVKTIKMKIEAKPGIPKVPIVRRRFNQLWNILYLQIIKDAPRNSNVTIAVESIGENVKVTVTDPGLTVAPEGIPKLFDEFYDPKHPASPQLAGTGLKFALIKTILAAHGGGAVAEKADPGTKLTLTFSTKIKRPGVQQPINIPPVTPAKPATPAAGTPLPSIGAVKPAAPGLTPSPAAPKPAGSMLDSLLAGKVPSVTAPGLKPPIPIPGMPTAAPGLPKPPAPAGSPAMSGGLLDALLDKKPGAPGAPVPPPMPAAPKPAAPAPSATSGALDALMGAKLAAPAAPPSAPGMVPPPALKPPSLGSIPPSPSMAPPMAPKPPVPAAPGAPVVPTSLKPTAPPPGILNMDNLDSFKVDASASPKPMAPPVPGAAPPMGVPKSPTPGIPAAPPVGAPKPPGMPMAPPMGASPMGAPKPPSAPAMPPPGAPKPPPLPGMPPGGLNASKPIVKDLAKEGEGDLIE